MQAYLNFIPTMVMVLLVALAVVLGFGVVTMGSDRFSPRFRNKLMQLRVAIQGLLILLFIILLASVTLGPSNPQGNPQGNPRGNPGGNSGSGLGSGGN